MIRGREEIVDDDPPVCRVDWPYRGLGEHSAALPR
jgi:hypothetical protein